MEMLLDGDDDRLAVLRVQLSSATISERIHSDSGFYTHFAVPTSSPRLSSSPSPRIIDDVCAEIRELQYPIMCMLWVTDGALDFLECVAVASDHWPEVTTIKRLYYMGPIAPGSAASVETNERNVSWALSDHAFHVSASGRRGPLLS
jgi:hypothetical protein